MTVSTQGRSDASPASSNLSTTSTPPLCASDPQSVIWQFFADPAHAPCARDTLLLWVMALPGRQSPQEAAGQVLKTYSDWLRGTASSSQQELLDLLRQVINAPAVPARRRNRRPEQATYH